MNFYLGIDIGSTNVKAIIFDENWTEIFSASAEVLTKIFPGGGCEQSPDAILEDADRLLEGCLEFAKTHSISLGAIGLSAAMHSFLAVNDRSEPVSPLLIWSDTRAHEYSRKIKETRHWKSLLASMNVPVHPMLPLAKWLWFAENSKIEFSGVMSMKDYLVKKWFGVRFTDIGMASATGFFDIYALDWNKKLLAELGLSVDKLPDIRASTEMLPNWSDEYRKKFGKYQLPPVVLGSTDGCLANLAAGVVDNTRASMTIGTSGAVRTMTAKPVKSSTGLFCYPVFDGYYVTGGATNNGGNVLQWFQKAFETEKQFFWPYFETTLQDFSEEEMGQLLFVPYLFGERAPLWEPEVKGAYIGMSGLHQKKHLLRASVEGVAFSLKHVLSKLMAEGNPIESIVADGGFTQSPAWVQLVSNVLGMTIEVPETSFGAAKGAVMLARMAVNNERLEDLNSQKFRSKIFRPEKEKTLRYDELFTKYLTASKFLESYFTG